jgi:hypothetical protein
MNVASLISSRTQFRWKTLVLLFGLFLTLSWFVGDRSALAASPTVTSVTPNKGPESGHSNVTISGSELTGATAVTFGGANATEITINESGTQITASSPAGTGTVDVTVTTPGGTSTTGTADQFTYVPPPTITAVTPSEGPEAGGTAVTITGTDLTGATAVKFGAGEATGVTVNVEGNQITATSPAGRETVDVTVTTPGGASSTAPSDLFTYVAPPHGPPATVVVSPPSASPPIVVVVPPSPAPVPKKGAVVCTLKVDHVHLPGQTPNRRTKAKPRAGTLTVLMTCDQEARVTLRGQLIQPIGKPRHGKQHTKRLPFGFATASVKAGVPKALTLRLPKPAVVGLEHRKAQKISFTIVTKPVTATT